MVAIMLKQLFHGPFAEESQTIPGIIHSNIDRETGEPIGQPERTTFEPFRIFKVPLESTSGEWSTGWEGPVAGTIIQSVDAREILGRGHSFVGGVSEQIELDIPGVGNGATAIGELTAKFGTDALGSYLPYHYFGLSRRSPWGIYPPFFFRRR